MTFVEWQMRCIRAFTDARWYMRRGGANSDVISRLMSIWIRMMSPITPHTAEELWESRGEKGFVSIAPYPECDQNYIDPKAEIAEQYLESVLGDINEILRVTGISPGSVHIYTTPDWKRRVLSLAIEMARSKQLNVPSLTKRTMSDNDMKKLGKEASDFARRTAEELMKRSEAELDRMAIDLDEGGHLLEAVPFLMKELGCEVHISSADDKEIYDPQKKARMAQPRRPALFIE